MFLTPIEIDAALLSLKVGATSVLFGLPFGLAIAYLLARTRFPGHGLVNGLVHLPLVLPPLAIGYFLLLLFGNNGPIGSWLYESFGISLAFNWKGAALAAAVVSFPLMVRSIRLSIELVDRGLEDAARTLGASDLRVFMTITLPLIMPGLLTGIILAFARSLGEFGATIALVSNIPGETQTIPLALFEFTQIPGEEGAALRLAVISVIIALFALAVSEYLARRVAKRIEGSL